MIEDQYTKLQELSTKLTSAVLFDADPDNWVGVGIKAADLTRDQRGDAYWCRKVAAATLSVLMRVTVLFSAIHDQRYGGAMEAEHVNLDKDIREAEAQADKLLDKLQERKTAFDKRIHGRV